MGRRFLWLFVFVCWRRAGLAACVVGVAVLLRWARHSLLAVFVAVRLRTRVPLYWDEGRGGAEQRVCRTITLLLQQ